MSNFSLITRGTGKATRILMLLHGDGWTLPRHPHFSAQYMNEELGKLLDAQVTTLECIHEFSDGPDDENLSRIYLHEVHGDLPTDPGLLGGDRICWLSAAELEHAGLAIPEHRPVLRKWLAEASSGQVPGNRLPWARRGWFGEACSWAVGALRRVGLDVTEPPQQIYARLWSCLIRIPVADGVVYLKASPPAFLHEPGLTELLSRWFPENVPRVIAVDDQRHWMLMHAFGPVHDSQEPADVLDGYLSVLPVYAGIQQRSAQHVTQLLGLNCPDHRLVNLPDRYDELLADEPLLYSQEAAGLCADDRDRLTAFSPVFRQICAALGGLGLPETLVHGDLWRGNFTLDGPQPLIFDWAEAVVAHPFLSLTVSLRDLSTCLAGAQDGITRARDAYLTRWEEFASPGQLRHLFSLAPFPAMVSRTLLWRNVIAGLEEDRRLFYRYAVPVNLRRLLPLIAEYCPSSGGRQ